MFRKYRRWKRKKLLQKVKRGDGHPLKPYRWWQMFHRSLFYIQLREENGTSNTYAVQVNYFSEKEVADLYKNGSHFATSKLPATFPVANGVIEVATTTYGLKRMHFVQDESMEKQLSPHPQSMEGLRLKLDVYFPRLSKVISVVAVIVLLISLILGLPQLVELISQIPYISNHWGTFQSPIVLPNWLNVTLLIAGTLAALERAITLRSHWLIDMETWWDD